MSDLSQRESPGDRHGDDRAIVLFDGTCALCDGLVRFLRARDPGGRFRFVANGSDEGRRLLDRHGLEDAARETVVLIEGDRVSTHSDAALRIARRLRWPWPLWYGLSVVPRFLRDPLYKWVARNRHRWSAPPAACPLEPDRDNEPSDRANGNGRNRSG